MQNLSPLISFVIPTHNRASVLRECLESVVNQTYRNIEVIVVNDNSIDNTEDILKDYSKEYSFFKYYNSNKKGGNAARNYGIKMAKGDYIAFMDDDDICELNRVEQQLKPIIESNYKYNFIVAAFSLFNSEGKVIKVIDYLKPMESLGFTVRWLIKKDLLLEAGGFDIEQPALQDVEFFWRLKQNAQIFYIPKPLVKVRDSQVSITKDPQKMINAIIRLLELHSVKMSENEKNIWLIQLCKILASVNSWAEYKYYLNKINKEGKVMIKILLKITLIVRENRILKIHSKLQSYFEKITIKILKRNSLIQYSS